MSSVSAHPPTQELLLPLLPELPPLPRRLSPRREPLLTRVRREGAIVGLLVACLWPVSAAFAQILGGAA